MGKGARTETNTNSQTRNEIDPFIRQAGINNYNQAQQVSGQWRPTMRPDMPAFNPDEIASQDLFRNFATGDVGGGALNSAQDLLNRAGSYTPSPYTAAVAGNIPLPNFDYLQGGGSGYSATMAQAPQDVRYQDAALVQANRGDVRDVSADQVNAAQINRGDIRDLATRMTPDELNNYLRAIDPSFTEGVLDPTLQGLDRDRQMLLDANSDAAARAGAFGGSRHGVVDAETNRGYLDQVARTRGDLNMQRFNTALQAFQADEARRLQAQAANQGVDYNTAAQNAGFSQQAGMANAANRLQAAGMNQGADLNVVMGNLSAAQQTQITNAAARLQAQGMNQQAALQTALANAGFANDASRFSAQSANDLLQTRAQADLGLANLRANLAGSDADRLNQAAQFNEGLNLNAAQLYSSLAPQFSGLSDQQRAQYLQNAGVLGGVGSDIRQQQTGQNEIDFQNQYAQDNAGLFQLGILQNALGMTPYNTTQTTTGSEVTRQSSPWWQTALSVGGAFLSDERLKKDVRRMPNAMSAIHKMRGVNYAWADGTPDSGLLAQDVRRAMPEATEMHGGLLHVNIPRTLGLLVEGMKDLDNRTKGKKVRRKAT